MREGENVGERNGALEVLRRQRWEREGGREERVVGMDG